MNKEEYLKELKHHLKRLPAKDYENAMEYFTEYFEEAGTEQAEAVMAELGTPKEAAAELVRNLLEEKTEPEKTGRKPISPIRAILIAVTAVLLLPIGFPIFFTGLVLILLVVLLSFSLFLLGVASALSLLQQGVTMIFDSIFMLPHSIAGTATTFGAGLFHLGESILIGMLIIYICHILAKCLLTSIRKITAKRSV